MSEIKNFLIYIFVLVSQFTSIDYNSASNNNKFLPLAKNKTLSNSIDTYEDSSMTTKDNSSMCIDKDDKIPLEKNITPSESVKDICEDDFISFYSSYLTEKSNKDPFSIAVDFASRNYSPIIKKNSLITIDPIYPDEGYEKIHKLKSIKTFKNGITIECSYAQATIKYKGEVIKVINGYWSRMPQFSCITQKQSIYISLKPTRNSNEMMSFFIPKSNDFFRIYYETGFDIIYEEKILYMLH